MKLETNLRWQRLFQTITERNNTLNSRNASNHTAGSANGLSLAWDPSLKRSCLVGPSFHHEIYRNQYQQRHSLSTLSKISFSQHQPFARWPITWVSSPVNTHWTVNYRLIWWLSLVLMQTCVTTYNLHKGAANCYNMSRVDWPACWYSTKIQHVVQTSSVNHCSSIQSKIWLSPSPWDVSL